MVMAISTGAQVTPRALSTSSRTSAPALLGSPRRRGEDRRPEARRLIAEERELIGRDAESGGGQFHHGVGHATRKPPKAGLSLRQFKKVFDLRREGAFAG